MGVKQRCHGAGLLVSVTVAAGFSPNGPVFAVTASNQEGPSLTGHVKVCLISGTGRIR